MPAKLPRSFYARETLVVARELLGLHLIHAGPEGEQVGRIVETEAYKGPHDLAAHSARGRRTRRTEGTLGARGGAWPMECRKRCCCGGWRRCAALPIRPTGLACYVAPCI